MKRDSNPNKFARSHFTVNSKEFNSIKKRALTLSIQFFHGFLLLPNTPEVIYSAYLNTKLTFSKSMEEFPTHFCSARKTCKNDDSYRVHCVVTANLELEGSADFFKITNKSLYRK